MREVGSMGEDHLIEALLKQVPLGMGAAGPGDDCAVIERGDGSLQVLKTDAIVEGVHWAAGTDGRQVGWKAVARVISDIAAMGAHPSEFLITLAMPAKTSIDWVTDLYRGMGDCLRKHGGVIAGGETSSSPEGSPIVISVAACGEVTGDHAVMRSTAKPGDSLLVTGKLGGSIMGKHLNFTPRIAEAGWLSRKFKPSAMMDLSDGLAADLPRLARASNCGFKLNREAIPCSEGSSLEQALSDGEDYELLIAIEAEQVDRLVESWSQQFDLPLSVIGKLCATADGEELQGGWDHFAKQ